MPDVRSHGGGCCGVRHLVGFNNIVENDLLLIDRELDRVPKGRLTEVVLTASQVRKLPKTLRKLADDGFVLVGGFRNSNSGNNCYVFHRCDYRVPLEGLERFWPGQVITPTMRGELVPPRKRTPQKAADIFSSVIMREYPNVRIGDPFVITSPTNSCDGMVKTVLFAKRRNNNFRSTPVVVFAHEGVVREVVASRCQWLPVSRKAETPPATNHTPSRHTTQ